MKTSNLIIRSILIGVIPLLFLPPIYWLSINFPILKHWKNIVIHIGLSILFCFSSLLIFQIVILLVLGGEFFFNMGYDRITDILTRQFFSIGSILFFSYWGLVVLLGLEKYYEESDNIQRKATDLQSELELATLSSLRAQLKPHFLFNTLSMVDQMISQDAEKAIEIVDKLERLLKNTFDRSNSETCTLGEEIEFLKKYLAIEKSRFQDRLEINYKILPETKNVVIPRYLLQPLVENAIVHGVSKTMSRCTITISSEFTEDQLLISVKNDGSKSSIKRTRRSDGIGLRNVEKRIKLYFGENASLNVESSVPGEFISMILIPRIYLNTDNASFKNQLSPSF